MSETLPVRVMVLDTWDELTLQVPPATPVSELKRAALARSRVRRPPELYEVKFRGAVLSEDGLTLADAGVPPHAALIVLPRRRIPVR
jgi:hypothetical protein